MKVTQAENLHEIDMPDYDFKQLSPHDFEQLSRDLIQARDGIVLESFKSGRDQGIDFRHARCTRYLVVQCKHYAGAGFSGLISNLKKEVAKVKLLNVDRYILVTSVGLSPGNKQDMREMFIEAVSDIDIIGRDDINNLLGLYPKIDQQHYKLWLASRAMLDRVIHNASLTQSDFDVERVHRDINKYVRSSAYPRALEMLGAENVVIISGAPGVGKTSLARMLLFKHIELEYEAVSILTDFQTGRERYQKGAKQVFYFDDFMGATFLGEHASVFSKNEDRAIIDFVEMIRSSPTTKLIMTTREHILRQAIATSERLKHSNLIDSRCVLSIGDYSRVQRAEILYNHIFFSELPTEYRLALLSNKFYMEIVGHKKFNPRLISWLSTFQRVKSIAADEYQNFVRDLLENPAEIWRHAYEYQISDAGRSVLLTLYTFNGACSPTLLEQAFNAVHKLRAQRYGFQIKPSDWRFGVGELGGSFIRPGKNIEVIDPSVLDMLNSIVRQDTLNAIDMMEGAIRFDQLRRILVFSLDKNSRAVVRCMVNEISRVVDAFERLLSAPHKIQKGIRFIYVDDEPEVRIASIVQAAEALKSIDLFRLAEKALEELIDQWSVGRVNIDHGLELLSRVTRSQFPAFNGNRLLRSRIVRSLLKEAATGCSSNALRDLLLAIKSDSLDDDATDDLNTAVEYYKSSYFSEELYDCSSVSAFESLDETLTMISNLTEFDFENTINSVRERMNEFENEQAAREDFEYDDWRDFRGDYVDGDNQIHDIFDSLRDVK